MPKLTFNRYFKIEVTLMGDPGTGKEILQDFLRNVLFQKEITTNIISEHRFEVVWTDEDMMRLRREI